MTATGHAVIGMVIAAKVANPVFGIPLAFASHFLADVFPHWDTGTHWRTKNPKRFLIESAFDVALSFIVGFTILFFFFPKTNLLYAFIMILVAQLPDWLMAPYLFFQLKGRLFKLAYSIQHKCNQTLDKPWGIINQVALLTLLLYLANKY